MADSFPTLYLQVRKAEHRLYTDAELTRLPDITPSHPHAKEWQLRKISSDRLYNYLQAKDAHRILELGCGNGWLARKLSHLPESRVKGMDVNDVEIAQAKRVFDDVPNLSFRLGNVFEDAIREERFDAIVLAACFQYFPEPGKLLGLLRSMLNPGGEIHIIDTHFHDASDVARARQATADYYASQGVPEMAAHYHHHAWDVLKGFEYVLQYDPKGLQERIQRVLGGAYVPFPWVVVV